MQQPYSHSLELNVSFGQKPKFQVFCVELCFINFLPCLLPEIFNNQDPEIFWQNEVLCFLTTTVKAAAHNTRKPTKQPDSALNVLRAVTKHLYLNLTNAQHVMALNTLFSELFFPALSILPSHSKCIKCWSSSRTFYVGSPKKNHAQLLKTNKEIVILFIF